MRLDAGSYPTVDVQGTVEDLGIDRDGMGHFALRHGDVCRKISRVVVRSLWDRSLVTPEPGDAVAVFGATTWRPVGVDPSFDRLVTMRCTRVFALDPSSHGHRTGLRSPS